MALDGDDLTPLPVGELSDSPDIMPGGAAPPANRLPLLAVGIAVVLIAGLIGVVVVSGRNAGSPDQRVAAAADAVRDSNSFRMEMVSVSSFGNQSVTISAEGAVDVDDERAQMTMDAGPLSLELRVEGTAIYIRLPEASVRTFGGKTWARIDAAALQGELGTSMAGFGAVDPTNPLDVMRQLELVSGDVVSVGDEVMRGIETTHFRTTLDLTRTLSPEIRSQVAALGGDLAKELASVPYDVWLDSDDRPVRQLIVVDMAVGPSRVRSETTVDLLDFGIDVEVEIPGAEAVVDVSPSQLNAVFGGAGAFS